MIPAFEMFQQENQLLLGQIITTKVGIPFVDNTSNTPSPSSKIDISNVPPPKSYTAIFLSELPLSRPYAKAAAVGSLIILWTFKPEISPAFL